MTTQAAFTPQEWTLLRTVPALVASGVAAADPGGILGGMKEAFAGMKGMFDSLLQGKDVELLQAMVADKSRPEMPDIKAMMGAGDPAQQLLNLKARVLERIREAETLVAAKATAEEAQAYRQMLMHVAARTAEASKEDSFFGFGGVRVSSAEQSFLNEVQQALHIA
jgi:hypothetical protein